MNGRLVAMCTALGMGAILLAGCSSESAAPTVTVTATETITADPITSPSPTTPSPTASTTPSPSASSAPEVPDAIEIAEYLQTEMESAYDTQKVTTKNDPNDLIGRPRGYTSAAYIYDEYSEAFDQSLDVDLGAKIEVFKTERDARSRYNYLKQIQSDSPILGTEYTYIEGPVLLRVAQEVPPKVARQYRDAFRQFMEPYV